MPVFSVAKTAVVDAPAEKVYSVVRDFRQWPEWSPWLIAEPGCRVDYANDGEGYSWDGEIIGSGGMRVVEEDAPNSIRFDLDFIKPWKSHAEVKFSFSEKDSGTGVIWTMDSKLPFLLFFMKKMMTAMIGMDYERGLLMLKDYIETGDSQSKLSFGNASFHAFHYVGKTSTCATDDIGPTMSADFARLREWAGGAGIEPVGVPLTIYHKWDIVNGTANYTSALPVAAVPGGLPDDLESGELPGMKTYAITHTGPYRHLGNAWSAGIMHGRAKQFAQRRGIHPFETYENSPDEVDEKELITVVHFPLK